LTAFSIEATEFVLNDTAL
jgi:hypothetical protein